MPQTIEFARHDGTALAGDFYAPQGAGKHSAIVALHGGGWQQGSRESYKYWGAWLAERGVGLFATTYRFAKPREKAYPAAVHDVRAAVQHLRGNAAALQLDPARLALMGDSAGAHLAALVALAGDGPAFAGAYRDDPHAGLSTKVKVVVGIYGVYDLVAQWNHDLKARPRNQIVEQFLGGAPMDGRRLYFEASPFSYVEEANNQTAFFLSYGTEDNVVDRTTQSDPFIAALTQARFFVRHAVMQGAGHFWMTDPIEEPGSITGYLAPRLLRFLAEKL